MFNDLNMFRKILFRSPFKGRFYLLVIGLVLAIVINTYNYCTQYIEIEKEKIILLDRNAFKIFFIFTRSMKDLTNLKDKVGNRAIWSEYSIRS